MKVERVAFSVVVSALVCSWAAGFGCQKEKDHPPEYHPGATTSDLGDPWSCLDLIDAGSSIRSGGGLSSDGGPLTCLAKGARCSLADTDAGVCDGGREAGSPFAVCTGVWATACTEAGAP